MAAGVAAELRPLLPQPQLVVPVLVTKAAAEVAPGQAVGRRRRA